jgi:hypothetical protein
LVLRGHQWRRNHEIGRSVVARKWNVPNHRNPQQCLNVRIMRMRRQWVPEENEEINLTFSNPGPDLLIAIQLSTFKLAHGQPELFLYQRTILVPVAHSA